MLATAISAIVAVIVVKCGGILVCRPNSVSNCGAVAVVCDGVN